MVPKKDVNMDLLSNLLYNIVKTTDENVYVLKTDFHKILYLLKKKLSKENSIRGSLPFYWYKHGPMSGVVNDALAFSTERSVLHSRQKKKATKFQKGGSRPPSITEISDYRRARTVMRRIVENYDFYQKRDQLHRRHIYRHAPYAFQPFFKFELLPALQSMKKSPHLERFIKSRYETVPKLLSEGEAKLPLQFDFGEFNSLFSTFVTLAQSSLENLQESYRKRRNHYLKRIANQIWDAFCKQLRLVEHDSYYEDQVPRWRHKYQRSSQKLSRMLINFENFINAHLKEDFLRKSKKSPPESAWATVAKEIIK